MEYLERYRGYTQGEDVRLRLYSGRIHGLAIKAFRVKALATIGEAITVEFVPEVYAMRVLAICGSLQAKSGNLALLKTAAASAPFGVELVLFDGLRDLPHFNPDTDASGIPESVTQWRLALTASDAVLIASPEYGFSLPGVLKNGIDWVIGSGELERKVVAITAAVVGPDRGRRGLQALRDALSAVRATIVGGEPIAKGPGLQPQVAALVQALVEAAAAARDHSRVDGSSPGP